MSFKFIALLTTLVIFPLLVGVSLWASIRVYRHFRALRQTIHQSEKPYCPSVWHQWTFTIPRFVGVGLLWLKALVDPWVFLIMLKQSPGTSLLEFFLKLTLLELGVVFIIGWLVSVELEMEWAFDQRAHRGALRLPLDFKHLFCGRKRVIAFLGQYWLWHVLVLPVAMLQRPLVRLVLLSQDVELPVSWGRLGIGIAVAVAVSLVFMVGFIRGFEQLLNHWERPMPRVLRLTLGYHVFLAALAVWVMASELSGVGLMLLAFLDRLIHLSFSAMFPFYVLTVLYPSSLKRKYGSLFVEKSPAS